MAAKIHLFARLAKLFFAMSKNVSTFAPDFDTCPGGGMVDTIDSKSVARKGVRVQVPPGVHNGTDLSVLFFLEPVDCTAGVQFGLLLRQTS